MHPSSASPSSFEIAQTYYGIAKWKIINKAYIMRYPSLLIKEMIQTYFTNKITRVLTRNGDSCFHLPSKNSALTNQDSVVDLLV